MTKLFFIIIFVFVSFTTLLAQETKNFRFKGIAFVNYYAFEDNKTGIKKLFDAYNFIDGGCCFSLPCKTLDKNRNNRIKIFVEPILNEISVSLRQVENENNLIILNGAEVEEQGKLLAFDSKIDITEQFVSFFNQQKKHLQINIPFGEIAVINTNSFFDKKTGLVSSFNLKDNFNNSNAFCSYDSKLCNDIFLSLNSYLTKEGFAVIFDSSKDLPEGIKNLPVKDVTNDFILFYNNKK